MGRLSYRQDDEKGAAVRLHSVASVSCIAKVWQMLLLCAFSALSWACGSDAICPSGTGGPQCAPSDDLGAPPDVPAATTLRENDDLWESDVPDAGQTDAEGSFETETTLQLMREVPDVRLLASPRLREREVTRVQGSDHATDHERAVECTALPEEHVDSRGAPPWRSFVYVERERGRLGWLRAA